MNNWMVTAGVTALSWLLPGGGYLLMRRYLQFAISFALVCAAFAAGLALQGGSLWIGSRELEGVDGFTAFVAQAGVALKVLAGAPYLVARMFYHAQNYTQGRLQEYGTTFLLCAGIMNLLALADALELRQGRRS
jgi:hypothetical protein